MDLLDHGYLNLIETWGSDERIIESARMSTDKGFQGWGTPDQPGDEKLLRYLWKNGHHTPFEMAGATFEVQAPIFVFREWHRHRTQSYNELSARYTELPELFYVPGMGRMRYQGKVNKQGSGECLPDDVAEQAQHYIQLAYDDAYATYRGLIGRGVAREVARVVLPVGIYSRMRASANLRNWLHFLSLRMAPNAQWEIRQYANGVHELLTPSFPRTMELFNDALSPAV